MAFKRLFIATKITLSPTLLQHIAEWKREFRFDTMSWVSEEVMHLTLRFLGKTPETQIPSICQALQTAAAKHSPISLSLDKLGVFGSRYAPDVIWLGFHDFADYKALFLDLESELLLQGVPPNQGNFVPHVTLARIRKVENLKRFWQRIQAIQNIEPQAIVIKHITLYQSKLLSDGPQYRKLLTISMSK